MVYEFHLLFEEMGLEFNLFLPSPRPWVSPQNVESIKTSHNCKPVEIIRDGFTLAFICSWIIRTGPAHAVSGRLPCQTDVLKQIFRWD